MNKYQKTPDHILDLHGRKIAEVEILLGTLLKANYAHVRIITGKGNHGNNGAVVRTFVKEYLNDMGVRFNQSKIEDGGEGAIDVFF